MKNEQFSSRWGLILASLGMAIGAGNLWRFPRLAGQYGGTFLILWIVFLLIWSIPILMAEFSIGKHFKKGVIGSMAGIGGKRFTWMGVFVAVCTLGIAFYYSVVTAWALRYLGLSLSFAFSETSLAQTLSENPQFLDTYWKDISSGDVLTISLHAVAVLLGCFFLYRGIQNGLEKANKVLIPSLFVLLIIISLTALNMEGGIKGLEYMFDVKIALFYEPKVWIEALSQSAWSTGAGWGLLMTLSSYSRQNEDVTLNTLIGGFGNNTASLMAGMAILPAVFAVAPSETAAISFLKAGNQSLTFTIIPQLFSQMAAGKWLSIVFFGAFFMAAFSSLLPMIELFTRLLIDWGFARKKAIARVAVFCILFGFPSAYSLDVFNNQDWVWGIGLIISGLCIVFVTFAYGIDRFKATLIDHDSDFKVPNLYFKLMMGVNFVLGIFLIYWWMAQGYSKFPWFDEAGNWNVLDVYSNATILTQWLIVLLVGILLNGFLYRKYRKES